MNKKEALDLKIEKVVKASFQSEKSTKENFENPTHVHTSPN